ncbi:MAG TPA: hypothetical protein VGG64_01320 [Pirellulales bacterium]|jgi:hypothetical protein
MNQTSSEPAGRSPLRLGIVFVVMAALALMVAWAGYSMRWIQQRHEVIGWGNELHFNDLQPHVILYPRVILSEQDKAPRRRGKTNSAPGWLWLFGERGYGEILINFQRYGGVTERDMTPTEDAELDRIRQLFPEAKVTGIGT